jgi:hypothetical protein
MFHVHTERGKGSLAMAKKVSIVAFVLLTRNAQVICVLWLNKQLESLHLIRIVQFGAQDVFNSSQQHHIGLFVAIPQTVLSADAH